MKFKKFYPIAILLFAILTLAMDCYGGWEIGVYPPLPTHEPIRINVQAPNFSDNFRYWSNADYFHLFFIDFPHVPSHDRPLTIKRRIDGFGPGPRVYHPIINNWGLQIHEFAPSGHHDNDSDWALGRVVMGLWDYYCNQRGYPFRENLPWYILSHSRDFFYGDEPMLRANTTTHLRFTFNARVGIQVPFYFDFFQNRLTVNGQVFTNPPPHGLSTF